MTQWIRYQCYCGGDGQIKFTEQIQKQTDAKGNISGMLSQ